MRTCIIQTNNAPESLIRFTEVKCFFDYKNEWLGFFDKVIITEDADSVQEPGWKINAGQYITTNIRKKYEKNLILDLVSFQKLSYNLSVENFFLKLCDCLPTFMFYDKVSCLS